MHLIVPIGTDYYPVLLEKKYIKKAISQPHIKINAFEILFYSGHSLKKKSCLSSLNNISTTTNEPYPVTTKKAQ
jgi:hypothetical protein